MSTNQLIKIDEQLFTELAPEQAAILEGGLRVQLTRLECLQAGDSDGANITDEVFAQYNGVDANALNGDLSFGRPTNLNTGQAANIFSLGGSSGTSATRVRLLDKDGPNRALADSIGSFLVTNSGFQQTRVIGFGNGRYRVTFNAFQ